MKASAAHVFIGVIARHHLTVPTSVTIQRLATHAKDFCFDCGRRREGHALEPAHAFTPMRISLGVEEVGGIALARNLLAEVWYDGVTDADWFLSLDDDVGRLTIADLWRMCRAGVDVIGAPLPGRAIQPQCLARAIKLGVDLGSYEEVHRSLSPLLLRYLPEGPRFVTKDLVEVESTSAGCLLISRAAVTRMIDAYGRFEFPHGGQKRHPPRLFNFTEDVPDDSYYFCQAWRELGGAVYVDAQTRLTHRGVVDFATLPLAELVREEVDRGVGQAIATSQNANT